MAPRFTYSRWDGTQRGFDLDADLLFDQPGRIGHDFGEVGRRRLGEQIRAGRLQAVAHGLLAGKGRHQARRQILHLGDILVQPVQSAFRYVRYRIVTIGHFLDSGPLLRRCSI